MTSRDISRLMVGRDVLETFPSPEHEKGDVVMKGFAILPTMISMTLGYVDNVSFNLRAGEILGVAGVEGCGQKENQ